MTVIRYGPRASAVALPWPASQSLTVLSSRSRRQQLAVRRECYGERPESAMALERLQYGAPVVGVPESDRLIARSRRQQLAVRRECYGVDR
jgi:hypothetical protein